MTMSLAQMSFVLLPPTKKKGLVSQENILERDTGLHQEENHLGKRNAAKSQRSHLKEQAQGLTQILMRLKVKKGVNSINR
jgi:hypothetical protein